KEQTVRVTVAEQPADLGTGRLPEPKNLVEVESVGLGLSDMTPQWAGALGFRASTRGVLIYKMNRRGVAAEAGLRPGMVITAVAGKSVRSSKAVRDALGTAALKKGVTMTVLNRNGRKTEVTLQANTSDD